MTAITITPAQMTALATAGLFECPDEDEAPLAAAIDGNRLTLGENRRQIVRIICDISNGCDELAHTLTGDAAKWARADCRALSNLYQKTLRA